jgi:23S rRNA pseudouridine1911/1915/1917 synthase
VELRPHTGRRHQLRKHLSELGNPILGDRDHGIEGLILNGKGLYLHASSLRFIHPRTELEIYIRAQLPKKFKKLFP